MILSPTKEPDWLSEDAANLSIFLQSRTGAKLLQMLAYYRPEFAPANAHPHKSFAASRDIAGYELAIKNLLELTAAIETSDPKPEREVYPDLEDDSKWPSNEG